MNIPLTFNDLRLRIRIRILNRRTSGHDCVPGKNSAHLHSLCTHLSLETPCKGNIDWDPFGSTFHGAYRPLPKMLCSEFTQITKY